MPRTVFPMRQRQLQGLSATVHSLEDSQVPRKKDQSEQYKRSEVDGAAVIVAFMRYMLHGQIYSNSNLHRNFHNKVIFAKYTASFKSI